MQKYLEVGQIVNTFGIKREVKVNPFTDDLERFEELKTVYVEKKKELILYEIEHVKYSKNMVILKLKGIENPEDAQKFKGCYLKIDRKRCKKTSRRNILYSRLDWIRCIYRRRKFAWKSRRHLQQRK